MNKFCFYCHIEKCEGKEMITDDEYSSPFICDKHKEKFEEKMTRALEDIEH